MSALKQIPNSLANVPKTVYGIRHGQAWHNVLFNVLGPKAYSDYEDTSLTAEGMQQAATAFAPSVDIVLVSPLMRTLQTANIMFPKSPQIALECLKEYPQHTELCNKRSNLSLLRRLFPTVDFSNLQTEKQKWPNPQNCDQNVKKVKHLISEMPVERVAIVSHSTWLKYWLNGSVHSLPELAHCQAYPLEL